MRRVVNGSAILKDQVLTRFATAHVEAGSKFSCGADARQCGEASNGIDFSHESGNGLDGLDVEPLHARQFALHVDIDTFRRHRHAFQLLRLGKEAGLNPRSRSVGTEANDIIVAFVADILQVEVIGPVG